MERMEVMRDHDNYRKTKDELISLLHLDLLKFEFRIRITLTFGIG
jgi:hypothetical protein